MEISKRQMGRRYKNVNEEALPFELWFDDDRFDGLIDDDGNCHVVIREKFKAVPRTAEWILTPEDDAEEEWTVLAKCVSSDWEPYKVGQKIMFDIKKENFDVSMLPDILKYVADHTNCQSLGIPAFVPDEDPYFMDKYVKRKDSLEMTRNEMKQTYNTIMESVGEKVWQVLDESFAGDEDETPIPWGVEELDDESELDGRISIEYGIFSHGGREWNVSEWMVEVIEDHGDWWDLKAVCTESDWRRFNIGDEVEFECEKDGADVDVLKDCMIRALEDQGY